MTGARLSALAIGLTGHLCLQMAHTLADRNTWPYCSYNMFSFQAKDVQGQRRVRLVTDRGAALGPAAVWGLLPLEFFRVDRIVKKLFVEEDDHGRRDEFCAAVLERLNNRPWRRWDEVKPSLSPPPGHRIVAMELYHVEVLVGGPDPRNPRRVRNARLLHTYDPHDMMPRHGAPPWQLTEA